MDEFRRHQHIHGRVILPLSVAGVKKVRPVLKKETREKKEA